VISDDESLGLCAHVWTDIHAFRSAATADRASRTDILLYEKAIDVYGGNLLPRDIYEDWAQHSRDELRTLHLRLLTELAGLCQSEGRCETAEELLQRVLHADPLREAEHRMLMRVYMHCGRRAEAARQYQACRDILKQELGVEPSSETEALYREIMNGDMALAAAAVAPATRPRSSNGRWPDPEIRYATTRDGVRIAYSTYGEGEPLVIIPAPPTSHLLVEWRIPGIRHFCESLAQGRRIIRYDTRGNGVTGGDVSEYTLDGLVADLEAVVDDLGLERFPLYAPFTGGLIAIAYAARHPERVTRMFLWSCYARGADFFEQPAIVALTTMLNRDWEQYCQAMGHALNGWVADGSANELIDLVTEGSTATVARTFLRDGPKLDTAVLLPLIRCPTLVAHRREEPIIGDIGHRLAEDLPGGRLTLVDQTAVMPWGENVEEVVGIIDEFLREEPTRASPPANAEERRPRKAPPVQYATTSDGLSIAYWTLGEGPPLVVMPRLPFSHLEHEWEIGEWRDWYERLAASRTVIRYDPRGAGLSQRSVEKYSLDSLALDVDAVADALGLDYFDLFGFGHSSPVAVVYAAEWPERVRRLALWCPYASAREFWRSSRTRAFQALRRRDWVLYTETAARALYGWAEGDAPRRCAAMIRASMDEETAETAFAAIRKFDVRRLLPRVKAPTLVMYRDGIPAAEAAESKRLASLIPGARLSVLNGAEAVPFLGDAQAVVTAIDEFLREEPTRASPPATAEERRSPKAQ
jgi:pimeloyl-ACP methyl ester carboxylesterase